MHVCVWQMANVPIDCHAIETNPVLRTAVACLLIPLRYELHYYSVSVGEADRSRVGFGGSATCTLPFRG